jgi:hypothetical protein
MTTKQATKKRKVPAKSKKRQGNGRFKAGVSGNSKGPQRGYKKLKTRLVEEKLAELNCDPIEGMVILAQDEETDTGIRAKLYSELANYIYPKRKAIELEHKGDSDLESVLAKAHDRVKQSRKVDNG